LIGIPVGVVAGLFLIAIVTLSNGYKCGAWRKSGDDWVPLNVSPIIGDKVEFAEREGVECGPSLRRWDHSRFREDGDEQSSMARQL
jgi:hypothetical protein